MPSARPDRPDIQLSTRITAAQDDDLLMLKKRTGASKASSVKAALVHYLEMKRLDGTIE